MIAVRQALPNITPYLSVTGNRTGELASQLRSWLAGCSPTAKGPREANAGGVVPEAGQEQGARWSVRRMNDLDWTPSGRDCPNLSSAVFRR
jgi:hypothetical protein